jgi:hypothetical protein
MAGNGAANHHYSDDLSVKTGSNAKFPALRRGMVPVMQTNEMTGFFIGRWRKSKSHRFLPIGLTTP